jgi:2-iminobutanoate/2-iminopropanoate deaminase
MRSAVALAAAFLACACTAPSVRRLDAPGRSDTLPFSHAVEAGGLVFIAGTLGVDPMTGGPPADPGAEVRLMLDDFRGKLELAGLGMQDLVSVQVFCSEIALYDPFNQVYATYFEDGRYPARAFIGSGPLLRGCRFEITGVAAR